MAYNHSQEMNNGIRKGNTMNPRILLSLIILLAACASTADAAQPKKINIIFIVTDDQSRWSPGCYGNKESKTPNMDRLAREGARFINASVATPVCSPSRGSLMTGRYGTQLGITDWITPKEGDAGVGLPKQAITWAAVLQRAGYVTGLVGKWHLGTQPQFHPTQKGFNHFMGFVGGGNSPMNPTLEVDGKDKKFEGSLPDILTDDAMNFVKQNKDRPFALVLTYRAPHAPYAPVPKVDSEPFAGLDPTIPNFPGLNIKQVKNFTREYYASIHSVDRNLGRLLAMLDELGLSENTIIVFTSDHGYMIGHHGLHHKGNGNYLVMGREKERRPNMFDNSLQVPLLVRWPGVVRPGTEVNELVSNIDTFASVLGMLKVPPPAYKQEGKDFSPVLRGEKPAWRETVFAQYDPHNGLKGQMRSARTFRWHLIRQYLKNGQPDELFDLQNDPEELRNLYDAPEHRQIREQLQTRLTEWMRSVDDPIRTP
jgi:choline-sulfatase